MPGSKASAGMKYMQPCLKKIQAHFSVHPLPFGTIELNSLLFNSIQTACWIPDHIFPFLAVHCNGLKVLKRCFAAAIFFILLWWPNRWQYTFEISCATGFPEILFFLSGTHSCVCLFVAHDNEVCRDISILFPLVWWLSAEWTWQIVHETKQSRRIDWEKNRFLKWEYSCVFAPLENSFLLRLSCPCQIPQRYGNAVALCRCAAC